MTSWSSRKTLELVLAARDRRPEAWDALYKRCSEDMGKFCRRFLGRRDRLRRLYETEDILQEAFLRAFQHIDRLENDASFYAWVRTIVRRNIALKRRDTLRDSGGHELSDRATLDSYENELALADESARVLELILELFPEHPEAMAVFSYLQFEEACTPESLTETLGISRRTVYRRLEEAARLLRKRLEG
jgi:RNA polymerase sigma-70 factor (ECF subfamily)